MLRRPILIRGAGDEKIDAVAQLISGIDLGIRRRREERDHNPCKRGRAELRVCCILGRILGRFHGSGRTFDPGQQDDCSDKEQRPSKGNSDARSETDGRQGAWTAAPAPCSKSVEMPFVDAARHVYVAAVIPAPGMIGTG